MTHHFLQEKNVVEDAKLKILSLQHRTMRKWAQFNSFKRKLIRLAGGKVGQWPATDFPVTTLGVKEFMWWLALPLSESSSSWHREAGPRGHSFTYMRVLSSNLLYYVEEKELAEEKKGMYASNGDVAALRQETSLVTRKIVV